MNSLAFVPRVPSPLSKRSVPCVHTRTARRAPVATVSLDSHTLHSFSHQISGEWSGYEGNFHALSGERLPVPDYYIPDEFVEWGLTPFGFESNHSIAVRHQKLYRKFFRVLPCVSLFADHVDTEQLFSCHPIGGHGLSIFADGAFVNSDARVRTASSKLHAAPRVEFRVPHPHEPRRAANITLQLDFEAAALVAHIRAVVEKWTCAYCDGAHMDGSSGYVEGWVMRAPPDAAQLTGTWRRGHQLLRREHAAQREGAQLLLPAGLDVAFEALDDGARVARAAWTVRGRRVALQRTFDASGAVLRTQRFVEQRQQS